MEHVKALVGTSVRAFLTATGGPLGMFVDPSLRQSIAKAKAARVTDLAAGPTGDVQEQTIRDLFAQSENSYEVIRMYGAIGGWPALDDELPEEYLDYVAANTARVLDQRDYTVHRFARRYLSLLDYGSCPTLGDCVQQVLRWPAVFQPPEINNVLSQKAELLKRITSATLRGRPAMESAALVGVPAVAAATTASHRAAELVRLLHEAEYTTTICAALRALDYHPLYTVLTVMVDPSPGVTDLRRTACRDTFVRLAPEFAAAKLCVDQVGSNDAKTTVNRFMAARKAALDTFPASLPAPTAIQAIGMALGNTLGAVATTLAQLQIAIVNLPDALAGTITIPSLLGTDEDNKARALISELHSQNLLAHTPAGIKGTLINSLLDGFTDDDDEIAVLKVLKTSQGYDQAEMYQLAASATWESLFSSFDGEEEDELEATLNRPV
ncbi:MULTISPECIES: hypothetical protein [unclassified Streptomyces]|uniref:hypothetical protein n=1 Tax=unclassified Streptomyces TaxID=2593676 RepID=UPI000823B2CC|nr:hypothetical protein [Streptomyces sp. AmelKG-E11A]SCK05649.1 hypothetical protein YW7DRAFT_00088 [Streptomyces sp. AmelKG-E11A]